MAKFELKLTLEEISWLRTLLSEKPRPPQQRGGIGQVIPVRFPSESEQNPAPVDDAKISKSIRDTIDAALSGENRGTEAMVDTCQVQEGTSGGAVKCNQPAVATVTDSLKSYRIYDKHARQMENSEGSHIVEWD